MKYIFSFLSGLAGAIVFTLLYNSVYNQTIGVVRMDELLVSHIETNGIKEMSTNEAEEMAEDFSVALDMSFKEVSEEYRVLLLVKPAVVAGAPDYTDIIKKRIKERLKQNE